MGSRDGEAETGPPIGRGDSREPLPLAAASMRLRGKPGRPARADDPHGLPTVAPSPPAGAARGVPGRVAVAPLQPRVLDLHGAAAYLGLGERKLRELARSGILPRVRIPLPHDAEVRKLLFDRADLDRLIEAWKERPEIGET